MRKFISSFLFAALAVAGLAVPGLYASPQSRSAISEKIDEGKLVLLRGNTRREANPRNDRGPVAANKMLHSMKLVLRRPAESEQELVDYIAQLHDPKSPNFHKWLTAREFGSRFGLAPADMSAVTAWLQSRGFKVNTVYPNGVVVDFSGTAGQVKQAFHTEIHNLMVEGVPHIGNMSDPMIPKALAPVVVGIASLNDFFPRPMLVPAPDETSGSSHYLVPADLAAIYNINPAFAAGITGRGQTIAVVEDTMLVGTTQADYALGNGNWNIFRKVLGLARAYPYGTMVQLTPQPPAGSGYPAGPDGVSTCDFPGTNSDDSEAALDVEWSSAAAPNAAIQLIACADTEIDFGGFLALQNLLNGPPPYPNIVSVSYGESEEEDTESYNVYTSQLYQQATVQGVSVFAASGDWGATLSDADLSAASEGISVSALSSTLYNVSVGGTDFEDTYNAKFGGPPVSTYWTATNAANYGSALSYIPEIPWNDDCASALFATFEGYSQSYGTSGYCNNGGSHTVVAGSGGPSNCATGSPDPNYPGIYSGTCAGWPKPSWQNVFGNPNDGVRDLPDVSLFASQFGTFGHAYIYCQSNCTGAPSTWSKAGGTSFASPIMAGIQALVNQHSGQSWGNPAVVYYQIGAAEYGSSGNPSCNSSLPGGPASTCVFHDVTQGDIAMACPTGTQNCYNTGGAYGVVSAGPTMIGLVTTMTLPFPGGAVVTNPGSGYVSSPTCTLSGGGGSGATCTANTTTAVTSLSLVSGGTGYTSTPTCTITDGGGSGATCTATRRGSAISTVTLTAGGTGYTSNPTCTISGGGGSGAACAALADGIPSITLTNPGSGYLAPPDCTISGGGGSGATCGAFLSASSFQPAYSAAPGWDFATGLGTVNVYNLVMSPFWTSPQ